MRNQHCTTRNDDFKPRKKHEDDCKTEGDTLK